MGSATSAGLLRVDLGEETVSSEPIPAAWHRRFVGGKGLAARLLYEELDGTADPLGPENALVLAGGPLTGYLPGEQRTVVVTKSPQTGGFLDSYVGGSLPARLVGALGDHTALLVTGMADEPVAIEVSGGTARIEAADGWWGLDIESLAAELDDVAAAAIGPAGEHGVRYATIATDGGDHHAGRGGAGAVMGAKRLKAIVVDGEPPSVPADLEPLVERTEAAFEASSTGRWHRAGGTVESVDFADAVGALATRGWQESSFDGVAGVGVDAVRERSTAREPGSAGVPGDFRVGDDGDERVIRGGSGMTLGAGLGIDDGAAVARLTATCDRLGLDLVSAGNAVAWAMRVAEAGQLDATIEFGDADAAESLLAAIAERATPLADALADGVETAADRYGGTALVPSIKGLELPNYDPRVAPSMALAYATSDRGACHRRARPIEREPLEDAWSPERAAAEVIREQDERAARWCLIADDFLGEALPAGGREWLAAIDHPAAESAFPALGERVWTLTRLFNWRAGWSRADDALPAALTAGTDADRGGIDPDEFDAMLDAYYEQRGWTSDGVPARSLLDRLGLATLNPPAAGSDRRSA